MKTLLIKNLMILILYHKYYHITLLHKNLTVVGKKH